jgi:hypothetical protein
VCGIAANILQNWDLCGVADGNDKEFLSFINNIKRKLKLSPNILVTKNSN